MNIQEAFKALNIKSSDHLIISSDTRKLLTLSRSKNSLPSVQYVLDALSSWTSRDGSVIVPTYTWEFCKNAFYDIKRTKSALGSLASAALESRAFSRTKHPIYSFAVAGKIKKELCDLNNISSWGHDSPFAKLCEFNAVNLFVGIDYKLAFTFDHHAEELAQVEYRNPKAFTGIYIDENEIKTVRSYSMYVRNELSTNYTTISESFDKALIAERLLSTFEQDGVSFQSIRVKGATELMVEDLRGVRKHIRYAPRHSSRLR